MIVTSKQAINKSVSFYKNHVTISKNNLNYFSKLNTLFFFDFAKNLKSAK